MRAFYLFEFCDQNWIPGGARDCLYEIMEACNSGIRSFNAEVAEAVVEIACAKGVDRIVELGAGRAPLTTWLANDGRTEKLTLIPCDITPNQQVYQELVKEHGDRVQPLFTSVDITQTHEDLNSAVLVMAGMMHHVPFNLRPAILETLSRSSSHMAIFEPLKRSFLSVFLASLSFVPAFLLPLTFWNRPGRFRRILWCWLIPIVPPMFVWDGAISCLRQWTTSEWTREFNRLGNLAKDVNIRPGFNSLRITWSACNSED